MSGGKVVNLNRHKGLPDAERGRIDHELKICQIKLSKAYQRWADTEHDKFYQSALCRAKLSGNDMEIDHAEKDLEWAALEDDGVASALDALFKMEDEAEKKGFNKAYAVDSLGNFRQVGWDKTGKLPNGKLGILPWKSKRANRKREKPA